MEIEWSDSQILQRLAVVSTNKTIEGTLPTTDNAIKVTSSKYTTIGSVNLVINGANTTAGQHVKVRTSQASLVFYVQSLTSCKQLPAMDVSFDSTYCLTVHKQYLMVRNDLLVGRNFLASKTKSMTNSTLPMTSTTNPKATCANPADWI